MAREEKGSIRGPTPSPFATFAIEWAVAVFAGEETDRSAKRGTPTALPERVVRGLAAPQARKWVPTGHEE